MNDIVRRICPDDAKDIYELNKRLGHDYEKEKVKERIQNVLDAGSDILLVMEQEDKVIGYVHGCPYNTLYADRLISIIVFVIQEDVDHREELSNALLKAFENLAIKNGYKGIRMAADVQRASLYHLMVENGYENKRDLKHYIKYFKEEK